MHGVQKVPASDAVGSRLSALATESERCIAQRDEVRQRILETTGFDDAEAIDTAHVECWKALIATRTRIVDLDAEIAAAGSAEDEGRAERRSTLAALEQVPLFHSQPLARAHCSTPRCPLPAALEHVSLLQSQPLARAHCSTPKCPPPAALEHVKLSQSQPSSRAHCSAARHP